MIKDKFIEIAYLPEIQRDLYLARVYRKKKDTPSYISTYEVAWDDMIVQFASDEDISEAVVAVDQEISLAVLSRRLECLLDCGTNSIKDGWTLKYSSTIQKYGGDAKAIAAKLCDRISSIDPSSGEVIGVMKIKRRSVSKGHAKIRILPKEDSLQIICRHQSSQGLKAVWKSVLWRLDPQYGKNEK